MNCDLASRYADVQQQIRDAIDSANRPLDSVSLLAVSKFHPVEDMLTLYALGQRMFGENYVQEALAKQAVFEEHGIEATNTIHLIGHIQSRKAAQVAGRFALIHSLDSYKLADGLEKKLAQGLIKQKVLIEVNIASEAQKTGIDKQEVFAFAKHVVANCPHLALEGLMCLPPADCEGEAARPYFVQLRKLRDSLSQKIGCALPHLSMGMSSDFACAIEEGATIVRIGTKIFGSRPNRIKN